MVYINLFIHNEEILIILLELDVDTNSEVCRLQSKSAEALCP